MLWEDVVKFYLGTHHANQRWFDLEVPLFASRRVLTGRKKLPEAKEGWALDSGGFTELNLYGRWETEEYQYVADVIRFRNEIGKLEWVAPMDWMCEPQVLKKTGLTVQEHQRNTVRNFLHLREKLGDLVIPVLQGWEPDDYLECWEMYEEAHVSLEDEPLVGVGSVCRRQKTQEAGKILRPLWPTLPLHYFGAKITGLYQFHDWLASADSMAWSYQARRHAPLPGCTTHKSCANCWRYAMRWRNRIVNELTAQERMVYS